MFLNLYILDLSWMVHTLLGKRQMYLVSHWAIVYELLFQKLTLPK